jgi:hypothetical protein
LQLRPVFALSLFLLAVPPKSQAASPSNSMNTAPSTVAIVELFTSEGCSSCPPADALLGRINLKQTDAGQLIVGISEHVTYWDHLGWKDPYSLPVFTDRQSVYASRLSPEGSYTPQVVLNGRDQFVGSDVSALERALRNDARREHFGLRILSSAPLRAASMLGSPLREIHQLRSTSLRSLRTIRTDPMFCAGRTAADSFSTRQSPAP